MLTRAVGLAFILTGLAACGVDRPRPRSPVVPEHSAEASPAQTSPKKGPSLTPISTPNAPVATCTPSPLFVCGPFSSELISLCLKFSTQDVDGRSACHGPRWSKAFHLDLAAKLNANEKTTVGAETAFARVMTHILNWEGGCSDHPQDRGGRTFKGITTERAQRNGWKGDVCTLPHATVLAIYRNEYWERRARLHAWPLDLAVMNTEVNSGGGRAQKILDRMKAENIGGGLVAQAKWFVDQQTTFYKDIVASDASQSVFLKGWLNRSAYMRGIVSGENSLSLYASTDVGASWTAKAFDK